MKRLRAVSCPLTGSAEGEVMTFAEPLSFWGGYDPATGEILDVRHPRRGERVRGRVLALPGTRGSGGTPAALAESIRRGVGPAGILLPEPDANLLTGALVADALYGRRCPIVVLSNDDFASIKDGGWVLIDPLGSVTLEDARPTD